MNLGSDYWGRFLGLPTDHPDNEVDATEADDFDDFEVEPTPTARSAAAAEDRWIAGRDMVASQ